MKAYCKKDYTVSSNSVGKILLFEKGNYYSYSIDDKGNYCLIIDLVWDFTHILFNEYFDTVKNVRLKKLKSLDLL